MTGRILGLVAGVLVCGLAVPAAGQSLGDVARQEAARRGQVKSSGKVLTNADLPASAVVVTSAAPAQTPAGDQVEAVDEKKTLTGAAAAAATASGVAADGAAADAKPTPASGDDEAGWRARAERVNAALAAARTQLRQLKALSDRLGLEALAVDQTVAARAGAERTDLQAQVAKADAALAAAQADHDALAQEARVAGVPPAWIQ